MNSPVLRKEGPEFPKLLTLKLAGALDSLSLALGNLLDDLKLTPDSLLHGLTLPLNCLSEAGKSRQNLPRDGRRSSGGLL